jgi:hypothetical protein
MDVELCVVYAAEFRLCAGDCGLSCLGLVSELLGSGVADGVGESITKQMLATRLQQGLYLLHNNS